MNRVVKFAVLPLAGIVVVMGVIAVYIAATFDPNRYKPHIEQAVKDQLGRTIRLEGDIKLSLFPGLGVTLGKVWLSERTSDQEFAGVEEIRIALKLRPLLSRQIVIDTVEIRNLRANVVRAKDGKINIDDLTGGDEGIHAANTGGRPFTVDIDHFVLRNATITYIDQAQNAQYILSKLDLETGRLASGVPSEIDLSFILQSNKPTLALKTTLKTTLTFDLGRRQYALQGLDLSAEGLAAGISDLMAKANGNVEARLAHEELSISKLSLAATGKQEGGDLNLKLEVAVLNVVKERLSGEGIALDATLSKRGSKMVAKLAVPAVEGTAQTFKANESTASLDLQQGGASIRAKVVSPLTGNVDTQRLELSKLALTVRVNNPRLLKQPLDATLNGTARADFARRTAALAFASRIDASSVSGKAELTKFAPPFYTFDIHIDQLDADRYLPERNPKQPDEPFDLSVLKDINASGSLRIDVLTLAGIKASNVRVEVNSANGHVDVGTPAGKRNAPSNRSGRMFRKTPSALSSGSS